MIHSHTNEAQSVTADDRELEALLADAFDTPPIPRSLLKRLDSLVEQEWGQSPRLADSRTARLQRNLIQGSRWVRRLPVAAALALVVIAVAVLNSSSTAYAWSSMLSALQQTGLVQLNDRGVTRWLSLSDGVVGESTAEYTVLLDVQQQVLLRRMHNETVIHRQRVQIPPGRAADGLVLSFLVGQSGGAFSSEFIAAAEISEESWQRVTVDGADRIQLNVRPAGMSADAVLRILVDPETSLPIFCSQVPDNRQSSSVPEEQELSIASFSMLSYFDASISERVLEDFPADMLIVDVASISEMMTAMNDTANVTRNAPAAVAASSVNGAVAAADSFTVDGKVNMETLSGAASRWKPVQIRSGVSGNPVEDLDQLISKLWEQNSIQPVAPASDTELLRRVYLDLAGRTPSVVEVRDYLQDASDDRYVRLVDRLLGSPDHSSHLAARFRSFLIPEGVDLTNFGGIEAFEKWLSGRFESQESYDRIVQSLLLAEGRLVQSGPLLFYSATKLEADQLAARTARVFLGMRLECAQCHDHPFEPWTQEDFWGLAAFFARISRPRGKLENVSTVMQVRDVARGEVMMPESANVVPPKFLNTDEIILEEKATERRRQLTQWLTGSENPYFARATANRVWSMLFGKGIVNPVDDFGVANPPLSPELLDNLAGHLIKSEFNLRELFRLVALSKAYRLSSGADDVNETRQRWFAQMNTKMLTAEQVYDCITVATMPGIVQDNSMMGLVNRFGNASRETFLREFRTPAGRSTEYQGGIPQALTLMNGGLIDSATGLASSGLLKSLEAPFFSKEQRIEILYFATLARYPMPAERELLEDYITDEMSGSALREALSDVLWALLNSAEFTMNH